MTAMPMPMLFKDTNGRYLACNQAFERYIGKDRADIIGATAEDIVGPKRAKLHNAADAALFTAGGTDIYESGAMSAKGERRQVNLYKSVFGGYDDVPRMIVSVIVDITRIREAEQALRQSEERWATLFRQSPNAMVLTELNTGKILEVNASWCATWDYDRNEIIGKTAAELVIWQDIKARAPFE